MAYLSCAPRRTAPRDTLVDLLWSDRSPEAGRHDLRQTVWLLRQRFGRDVVAARRGEVSLVADVTSDRETFLEAIHSGNAERAVVLYGGEYLPGGSTAGTEPYEEWVRRERYRLGRLFCGAAQDVVHRHVHAGRGPAAVELARRVRDILPDDEDSWRAYLEALIATGRWAEVSSEADILEWTFAVGGREPSGIMRDVLRAARHRLPQPVAAHTRAVLVPPVGRDPQMGRVLRAWENARRGTGNHLEVAAPTGFGKTSFLMDVNRRLSALGARSTYVAANPGARDVPHVFIGDVVGKLAELPGAAGISPGAAAALVALNPSVSSRFAVSADPTTGDEAMRRRFVAVMELLHAVAEERPLLLLLDDLHWADGPSRHDVERILERVASIRGMVITAASPVAPIHQLTDRSRVIHLSVLTHENVREIIDTLAARPEEAWANDLPAGVYAVAGGSPLLTLEVLQEAIDRGALTLVNGCWGCPDPASLGAEFETIRRSRLEPADVHPRSVLVMRFAGTQSGGLSDGFTERLITLLSRVQALRVTAWPSARQLNRGRDPSELAGELHARYLVQGSLRVNGRDAHVTAQLTDALTGTVLWGDSRRVARAELPEMEQQLARAITATLSVPVTDTDRERLHGLAIPNAGAYECYLRAREALWHGHTPEQLKRAVWLLRTGLKHGRESAVMYSALGTAYALSSRMMRESPWSPLRGAVCVRRALALDPQSSEAHYLQALQHYQRWEYRECVTHLLNTLELDPDHRDALFWCSGVLGSMGKAEAARRYASRLLETDPLTPANLGMAGWLEWLDGRFDSALGWYRRWLRVEPNNPAALYSAATVLVWNRQPDEAARLFEELAVASPDSAMTLVGPFVLAVLKGDRGAALTAFTPEVARFAETVESYCWVMASYFAMIEARDLAVDWLGRAADRGFLNHRMLAQHDPFLRSLDGDPGFTRVLDRVRREWEALPF